MLAIPSVCAGWLVGWVAAEDKENWLIFWLRNAGLKAADALRPFVCEL